MNTLPSPIPVSLSEAVPLKRLWALSWISQDTTFVSIVLLRLATFRVFGELCIPLLLTSIISGSPAPASVTLGSSEAFLISLSTPLFWAFIISSIILQPLSLCFPIWRLQFIQDSLSVRPKLFRAGLAFWTNLWSSVTWFWCSVYCACTRQNSVPRQKGPGLLCVLWIVLHYLAHETMLHVTKINPTHITWAMKTLSALSILVKQGNTSLQAHQSCPGPFGTAVRWHWSSNHVQKGSISTGQENAPGTFP